MFTTIKYAIRRARARNLAKAARQQIFDDCFANTMSEAERDRAERYWFRMANIAEGRPPFTPWY